jgi:hypothetical protein
MRFLGRNRDTFERYPSANTLRCTKRLSTAITDGRLCKRVG